MKMSRRGLGEEGWLLARELQYAPKVGVLPSKTSEENSNAYKAFNRGGDKMSCTRNGYARQYSEILLPRLTSVSTIVELGVFQGASLAIWCDLFPHAIIIGLDIDFNRFDSHRSILKERGGFSQNAPICVHFDALNPRTNDLDRALNGKSIDVFIDDGPHDIDSIIATATAIFPLMAQSSVYVIEDNVTAISGLREAFPLQNFWTSGGLIIAEFEPLVTR